MLNCRYSRNGGDSFFMKNRWLTTLVKVLILCGMLLGAAAILMVVLNRYPDGAALLTQVNGDLWGGRISAVLAVLCVLGGEYIGATLFAMMCSLSGDPFVERNVKRLRNMGIAALSVMALALCTLLFRAVPLLVVGALPVGMCGLFSLVLSQVFSAAVAAKQENDLTV